MNGLFCFTGKRYGKNSIFFFFQVFTLLQGRDKEAVSFKIIIPTLFQAVKVTPDSSDSLNFW